MISGYIIKDVRGDVSCRASVNEHIVNTVATIRRYGKCLVISIVYGHITGREYAAVRSCRGCDRPLGGGRKRIVCSLQVDPRLYNVNLSVRNGVASGGELALNLRGRKK